MQEQIAQGKQPEVKPMNVDQEDEIEVPKEKPAKSVTLNADEVKDLALWRQMATRFYRKGKGTAVDFECKALPEELAAPIRVKLAEVKNELDIVKAFEINEMLFAPLEKPNDDIRILADAINKAVEKG